MATKSKSNSRNSIQSVEAAQNDVRLVIKNAFLHGATRGETAKALNTVIENALQGVTIDDLKASAVKSLWRFANRQVDIWQNSSISPEILLLMGYRRTKTVDREEIPLFDEEGEIPPENGFTRTRELGLPNGQHYDTLWRERIKPTLDRLVAEKALDPNDLSGRNSLRNLAEMEVRYQGHKDNIADLKAQGLKIVQCSAHADCSKRCAPWQGRLYSLDGTSGEINGQKYIPLEVATDIYYTTRTGRVYKNGLLGFNCRHYLSPYDGRKLPIVSEEERKREYAITEKQRELERMTRAAKSAAAMYKGINDRAYRAEKQLANVYRDRYIRFCEENNRPFYNLRLTI